MTPEVIVEGDKIVLVMGVDRLELDTYHAQELHHQLRHAVNRLLSVQ